MSVHRHVQVLLLVIINIGPLPAIFGMGAAVAAVIAFLTLKRKS